MRTVIEVAFWVAVVVAAGVFVLWLGDRTDRRAMRADADRLAGGR